MRELMRKTERQIADLQQSLKSGRMKERQRPREVLARMKEEVVERLGVPLEKTAPLPNVGATVRVKTLGREATVTSIHERGRVELVMGGLSMRVDAEDLEMVKAEGAKKSSSKTEQIGVDIPLAAPRWEVNVIGLRVDEALPMVEKALDEALLGGLASISIIHGKGTGRLKKGIRDYLSGHALVSRFHPGHIDAGGDGVTIVEIISE
jgi:DNA mismatch repair protein MutS2